MAGPSPGVERRRHPEPAHAVVRLGERHVPVAVLVEFTPEPRERGRGDADGELRHEPIHALVQLDERKLVHPEGLAHLRQLILVHPEKKDVRELLLGHLAELRVDAATRVAPPRKILDAHQPGAARLAVEVGRLVQVGDELVGRVHVHDISELGSLAPPRRHLLPRRELHDRRVDRLRLFGDEPLGTVRRGLLRGPQLGITDRIATYRLAALVVLHRLFRPRRRPVSRTVSIGRRRANRGGATRPTLGGGGGRGVIRPDPRDVSGEAKRAHRAHLSRLPARIGRSVLDTGRPGVPTIDRSRARPYCSRASSVPSPEKGHVLF